MDGDANDLTFLLARVRREITVLREDERLAVPLGTRGAALHQHVLDLINAVEHRLTAAPGAGSSAIATKAFARTVRQAIVELQSAHRALPWLSATREPHLNLGSLYLTEEFARDLVGKDVDLVVVPDAEYMYSTTSWPFRRYISGVHGFTAVGTRRPIVLNFPLTDSDRLLLHPIFAHELGHSSVDEHDLADQLMAKMRGAPGYKAAYDTAVQAVQLQIPTATVAQIEDRIDEWLADWCTEVLCDALGIEIAGPAFLYALGAFLMALGYGEPGSSHPPNTLRIKLVLDHLRARGWEPHLAATTPGLLAWFDSIAGDARGPLRDPSQFIRDRVLGHADDLRQLVATRVGTASLDVSECMAAAAKASELLRLNILPVELDGRLDRRGILTGGWHVAIEQHGDTPDGLVAAISDDHVQDLIGKALELSTVVEAWEQL